MESNEVKRNLINAYRKHLRFKQEASRLGLHQIIAQRDVAWEDALFAVGLGAGDIEEIQFEESKKDNRGGKYE